MHVLFVTEEESAFRHIERLLSQTEEKQPTLQQAPTCADGLAALRVGQHDIALIDGALNNGCGVDLLSDPAVQSRPVILLYRDAPPAAAFHNAGQSGADDILDLNGLDAHLLAFRIQRAIERRQLKKREHEHVAFVKAVHDSMTAANSALDLNQLLDRIIGNIQTIVRHDAASIMLVEANVAHIVQFRGYNQPGSELVMAQPLTARPDLQHILKTGRPLVITDCGADTFWTNQAGPVWIRSHVGIPLILRHEIIGILNLESREVGTFNPGHLDRLKAFAEHISGAIHNSRLHYAEVKRRQELETLHELTTLVSSTLDLDPLMELLLSHLRTVVPYDAITMFLAEGDTLEIVANQGFANPQERIGQRIEVERYAVFSDLKRTHQPLYSPDAQTDPRFKDWDILTPRRSWLGVPLLAHGIMIGCMVMDCDQVGAYGKAETALVSSFANQASIAIHNAQLYEELRRYANELEARVAKRTAELLKANEALSRSEERYRTLFESTFEGICVHEDGWLLETNQAFRNLFGYSEDEFERMHILKLAEDSSRQTILANIRSRNERPYEAVGLHKNGTPFPAEILGKQHTYEGRPVRVAAVRDLTERKAMERQQLDLALERERTQILTRFISQASHEFRTPLTIISINAAILKRLGAGEAITQRAELIQEQVKHVSTLVGNMLTLSMLDNEQESLPTSELDLNSIVETTRPKALLLGEEKHQTIVYDLADSPLYMQGNSEYLKQAVMLLIENACGYTPIEGAITVRTRALTTHAVVEVNDTGPGINSDHLPHIFERFYRADQVGTTRGFGLGLSIARVIAERHQGWIEVSSTPAQGSTFTLHLPLA